MKSSTLLSLAIGIGSGSALSLPEVSGVSSPYVTKVEPTGNLTHLEADGGCTFQAFSGNTCNGNGGAVDGIGGSPRCILCQNRHSFFLSSGCPTTSVVIYSQSAGCTGSSIQTNEGPGCYNVNTGQNWQSSSVTA